MSLLSIARDLALNVGLEVPDVVISSPKREWAEAVEFCNLVGEEMARRVDWGELQQTQTLTGNGANKEHDLGEYFSRVSPGIGVVHSTGFVRPLSRAEWGSLTPTEGNPRYFLLEGATMTLWPYLGASDAVSVTGQKKAWCSNGADGWTSDEDTALIDEDIMLKGLIVRWRRQKGMDYADYEAEYEAALRDLAGFNDRSRL